MGRPICNRPSLTKYQLTLSTLFFCVITIDTQLLVQNFEVAPTNENSISVMVPIITQTMG